MGKRVRLDVGVQLINPEYISLGSNCWIDKYSVLMAGPPRCSKRIITRKSNQKYEYKEGDLVIGRNSHIATHSMINAHGGVDIKDNSSIAAGAKIFSLSHHYRNISDPDDTYLYKFSVSAPEREQALICSPVVIEENAALAVNGVVLPGGTIGKNSWVTVGSTVMGEVPPGCIAAGTPAKKVKDRPGA